jgi:hypothetical protein
LNAIFYEFFAENLKVPKTDPQMCVAVSFLPSTDAITIPIHVLLWVHLRRFDGIGI